MAKVLFYGNEFTLLIFELMTFVTFDLAFADTKFGGSYFIAASITFLVYQGVAILRRNLGQKNICQKTLIDDRFMI